MDKKKCTPDRTQPQPPSPRQRRFSPQPIPLAAWSTPIPDDPRPRTDAEHADLWSESEGIYTARVGETLRGYYVELLENGRRVRFAYMHLPPECEAYTLAGITAHLKWICRGTEQLRREFARALASGKLALRTLGDLTAKGLGLQGLEAGEGREVQP